MSVTMPVTLLAALNEAMRSGRSRNSCSFSSRSARSMWPSASSWMVTTSAMDSRHGSSLLWCSNGPMNTTGRSAAGIASESPYRRSRSAGSRRFMIPTSLLIAPVEPEPQKMTQVSSSPLTASRMMRRASSRSRVVCRPVPLDSVCVFA